MSIIFIVVMASTGLAILSTQKSTYMIASLFYKDKLTYVPETLKSFIKNVLVNLSLLYLLLHFRFTKNGFYLTIIYVFIGTQLENIRKLHKDISLGYIIFELIYNLIPLILLLVMII